MNKRTEGILKVTQGTLKRTVAMLPVILTFGFAGVAVDGIVNYDLITKELNKRYEECLHSSAYNEFIQSERKKIRAQFDNYEISWQEYNNKLEEINSMGYLKSIDEDFAKQTNKQKVRVWELAIGAGFCMGSILLSLAFCNSIARDDGLWCDGSFDIEEGKSLLKKAKEEKTKLNLPEDGFISSIEDEYL